MMSDSLIVHMRYRLREWGRWYHRIVTAGLNYSNQSCVARLQKNGGIIIPSTARELVPPYPDAEEVDAAIENLAKPKPEGAGQPILATVIRIHYTLLHQPEAEKLRAAKLSRCIYYRYLHQAEHALTKAVLIETKPFTH